MLTKPPLTEMAKIHPLSTTSTASESSSACSTSYISSKTETFTVWMKSLVMQANGCTVYDDKGDIVFRVDNYDKKGCNTVYLMDLKGNVVFTILRKRNLIFRQWRGYKSDGLNQKHCFVVGSNFGDFECGKTCQVTVPSTGFHQDSCYKLEALDGKLAFRITNRNREIVAEAKRKVSSSGVRLGDDVLSLVVEPHIDYSFIMALVVVYGLIHHRL